LLGEGGGALGGRDGLGTRCLQLSDEALRFRTDCFVARRALARHRLGGRWKSHIKMEWERGRGERGRRACGRQRQPESTNELSYPL